MPAASPADASHVLLQQSAALELAVRRWQQKLPRGDRLGPPANILESIAGALWLELAIQANPAATALTCLRRVLYREFERNWQHTPQNLATHAEFMAPKAQADDVSLVLDLPRHLLPWAEEYLRCGGPQGRLDRGVEICGSRRQLRLRNTAILRALAGGQYLRDLERRAARLLCAVAVDGPLPRHVRAARDLQCILKMLEASPQRAAMRRAVSNIAALQRPASHAETAESANG
jgi:hypothetical protein